MDQAAKHPALTRPARSALSRMLGEIYQQLGFAWDLLPPVCGTESGGAEARGAEPQGQVTPPSVLLSHTWSRKLVI
jgi:hypothetical protein